MENIAQVCEKNLAKNEVVNNFKGKVADFREVFPVVSALKSPYLKTSHWNELYALIFSDDFGFSPPAKTSQDKQTEHTAII